MTLSPKALTWIHTTAVAIGTGIASFLTGFFATGLPATKAGWHALWVGAAGAGLSRLFGALLNLVKES
jgi:hypothetical protein